MTPFPPDRVFCRNWPPTRFFHDWLDHPQPDGYWQQLSPELSQVNLPMLHIGGWFDPYLKGNVRLYRQMRAQSNQPQHLWIGPWGHIPWGRRVGNRDFGPAADSPIDQLQLRWFDWILKGNPTDLAENAPVQLFAMGGEPVAGLLRLALWPSANPLSHQQRSCRHSPDRR